MAELTMLMSFLDIAEGNKLVEEKLEGSMVESEKIQNRVNYSMFQFFK